METLEKQKNRIDIFTPCDSCGARSLWAVTKDDSFLTFCGHHLKKHQSSLIELGWELTELYDE